MQMVRDSFPGPAGDDILSDLDALAALSLKWASPELLGQDPHTGVTNNSSRNKAFSRSKSPGYGATAAAAAAAAAGGVMNKDVGVIDENNDNNDNNNSSNIGGGNDSPEVAGAFMSGLSRKGTLREAREAEGAAGGTQDGE